MNEEIDSDDEEYFEGEHSELAVIELGPFNDPILSGTTFIESRAGFILQYSSTSENLLTSLPFNTIVSDGVFRSVLCEAIKAKSREYKPLCVSSMIRLSDNVYSTSKHNIANKNFINLYAGSDRTMIVNNPFTPNILWKSCFLLNESTKEWPKDRSPINAELFLSTDADISFVKSNSTNELVDTICYPTRKEPQIGEEIYCVGFPANYSDDKIRNWFQKNYVSNRNKFLKNCDNPMRILCSQINIIRNTFLNNGFRITSVGKITSFKDGIIAIDASAFPGMSGGACFNKDGKLLGSLIGSIQGENYNMVLSVLHPAFMYGYQEYVIPDLKQQQKDQLTEYLALFKETCCSGGKVLQY